jgi:hypothetical protein
MVVVFIWTVHKQQRLLSQGVVPSDELLFDSGEPSLKPKELSPARPPPAEEEEPVPVEGQK